MKTWVKVALGHGLVRSASYGARAGHLAPRSRQPRTLCWPAPLLHPAIPLRGRRLRVRDLFSAVWLSPTPAAGERFEAEGMGYVPEHRLVLGLLVVSR